MSRTGIFLLCARGQRTTHFGYQRQPKKHTATFTKAKRACLRAPQVNISLHKISQMLQQLQIILIEWAGSLAPRSYTVKPLHDQEDMIITPRSSITTNNPLSFCDKKTEIWIGWGRSLNGLLPWWICLNSDTRKLMSRTSCDVQCTSFSFIRSTILPLAFASGSDWLHCRMCSVGNIHELDPIFWLSNHHMFKKYVFDFVYKI